MNKIEALKIVGRRVTAWTSMNGVYTGVLKEVIARPRRPWRGIVVIDGVLEVAAFQNRGIGARPIDRQRRGFRPGEELEVGGVNINRTEDAGLTYLEALKQELAKLEEWSKPGYILDHHRWWLPDAIEARKIQIEREQEVQHE